MKKLTLLMLMTLIASTSFAANEVPHTINFQSVLRDDGGNLIADGPITLNFKILDVDGTQLYQETQSGEVVRGTVNVMIGEGDIPGSDAATGGIPLNALDPSHGEKFVQYQIGTNQPVDPISIGSIPYALWAEKSFGVVNEGVTTESIKNGTIKAEDLEVGTLHFSDINGLIGNNQLQADVLHLSDLNTHITNHNAHMASTIGVVGPLATTHSNVLEDVIKDMDRILNGLNQSSIDRTTVTSSINIETNARTTADTALGVRIDSLTTALSSEASSRSTGDSTLTTAIASRVNKSGDVMSGNLSFNNGACPPVDGEPTCLVDGVDVSALDRRVTDLGGRVTNLDQLEGTVSTDQVPQYMRPFAFGAIVGGSINSASSYNLERLTEEGTQELIGCTQGDRSYHVTFSNSAPNAAYNVIFPPIGGEAAAGYNEVTIPTITSKDRNGFTFVLYVIKAPCVSSNRMIFRGASANTLSFVVYHN